MVDHTERVLDEELLRTIARRLGRLTHVETVSVFPREKPESVVAVLDDQYYPATLREVTVEVRLYDDGAFYITYREDWGGESWMCRWDRHDNPHSTRDHYHEPPEARTEDAIDQEYPSDIFAVVERVFEAIDDRLGVVWEEHE